MVGTGIVVQVKAVSTTTKLGAISGTEHGTISHGRRSSDTVDSGTAVFRKHRECAADRSDR